MLGITLITVRLYPARMEKIVVCCIFFEKLTTIRSVTIVFPVTIGGVSRTENNTMIIKRNVAHYFSLLKGVTDAVVSILTFLIRFLPAKNVIK